MTIYEDIKSSEIPIYSLTAVGFIAIKFLKFGTTAILVACVYKICTCGIYFAPYFASEGKLKSILIFKYGIKKLIPVLIITFLGSALISAGLIVLSFIPIVNVFIAVLTPILAAMCSVFYDYLFSINIKNDKPIYYQFSRHFKDLYLNKGFYLVYAIVLALLYPSVIGAFLFRPYIQFQMMMKIQDEGANLHIRNLPHYSPSQ